MLFDPRLLYRSDVKYVDNAKGVTLFSFLDNAKGVTLSSFLDKAKGVFLDGCISTVCCTL